VSLDDLPPISRPVLGVAKEATSLADMFVRRVQATPRRKAWRSKKAGRWVEVAWQEFGQRASAVASWLVRQGLGKGDSIVIVGSTRAEWGVCDVGGQLAGLVTVGAYPTLSPEQLAYVIDHSDARVVFLEGKADLEHLRSVKDQCPKLERIVVWDMAGVDTSADGAPAVVSLAEVLACEVDETELERRREAIVRDDVAIIVYTSGTTGPPKGAMLTHGNILTFLTAGLGIDFDEEDEMLTFLPMAHVAERIAGFYMRINTGYSAAFASSIPAVLEEVKEVRPSLFGSVPRIFEKAYDRIQGQVQQAPPVRRMLFRWAERVGLRVVDHWQRRQPLGPLLRLQHALADRIVFSKIRGVFGGRVRFFITGAAPIPMKVLQFFWAAGFPIFEVYGQTEATVITHGNRPGKTRLGSVGQVIDGLEHKLAEDGEVLIRGPLVFAGYHKEPQTTREAVGEDGWLRTGDIGRIDEDGYLYIVDRKKHIIITAGGKNITPANIENEIKTHDPLISQVHAHGDRRPYVSALVTLSPMEAIDWAQARGMVEATAAARMKAELMGNPLAQPEGLDAVLRAVGERDEVQKRVIEAVRRGNARLSHVERVKRVMLLDRELSLAEDEVTPTLKVKRKTIEKRFAEQFERLYADEAFGLTVEKRGD
jgi:long-chain acyl-CoA synthetase